MLWRGELRRPSARRPVPHLPVNHRRTPLGSRGYLTTPGDALFNTAVARAKDLTISAIALFAAASADPASLASADGIIRHRVTYIVTADRPTHATIYFRDTDPPSWDRYSHNPYQFTPEVEADLAPGRSWTREAMLGAPERWAMVSATSSSSPLHCQLTIDGTRIATDSGAHGALCSLRSW